MRAVVGEYVLLQEIGRGGMGVVYLARDEQLERQVALKTLPVHLAADADVRSRFLREARTAAALSHPNIVPIYRAAERDGIVYFVMRYVPGDSLAERVAAAGTLSVDDTVTILRQLAAALSYAHARGVVHRDLKAENVLLDADTGRAMLTDFGIARLVESKAHTATGTVLGTVHYMSPEQVSGELLDGRSDLYALGVLAFLMLCGRFPFERNSASAVLVAHVNAAAPRLREVAPHAPVALGEIVDRLLSKSREARYESGDAVRAALDGVPAASTHVVRVSDSGPLRAVKPGSAHLSRDTSPNAPRDLLDVLPSAQAQEVWARAAELQANTGLHVQPAVFTPRVSPTDLVTQGYDAATIRESALDAGIDAKYVDRAMLERAVATVSDAPLSIEPSELMAKRPNRFLGSRTKLDFNAAFEGEVDAEAFEEVVDEVRKVLGEMTTVSAVGRTLTITTGMPTGRQGVSSRFLQVHLASRHGKTRVRVFEDLNQTALGLFLGLGMGAGLSGGMLSGGLVAGATHSPVAALAVGLSGIAMALLLARTLLKREVRKKSTELESLLHRVVSTARRSMLMQAEENRRLPRGTKP